MQHKTLDIITLFHKASSPSSVRVASLLKQASASAQAGATLDQASDHSTQTEPAREPFELNITEEPPTPEQVQTILEYVGKSGVSQIIKGAKDEKDALRKFKESKENLLRPVVSTKCKSVSVFSGTLANHSLFLDCGLEQWQGHRWRERIRDSEAGQSTEIDYLSQIFISCPSDHVPTQKIENLYLLYTPHSDHDHT